VTASKHPTIIDRFLVNQVLGQGSQAIVYLATDPDLNRKVAIKSVHLSSDINRQDGMDSLLSEARAVSRLQHPNIVTIYDLGVADQQPFLVLEYIEGLSLRQKMGNQLSIEQCIRLMRDILSGVAAAHAQNIIHCDLKPENILITIEGNAKVADFGLAQLADASRVDEEGLYGTPQYMAPEYIETRQHQTVSDVFSLGLVFYEMLTRKTAVNGEDVYQILNAIANVDIDAPSSHNVDIDEGLDTLIMKSLEKNPENRYADAGNMLKAFNEYLSLSGDTLSSETSDTTVNFLLRRMRHKGDFPAFSQTISQLNKASSSDTDGLMSVSNTILKDYALTNKVLRLVNSAYYSRGGGKISTISRAVVMLGINPVRSIAAALMLFEHLQNKQQSQQLKEDAVQSLFSALVANELAASSKLTGQEEAFLCALLEQLGKLLSRFYLHEETLAIDKLMMQEHYSEQKAVSEVLGTSYHQLGMSIAREWGFPGQIIESMKPLNFDHLPAQDSNTKKLCTVSQFSNALGRRLQLPQEQQSAAIDRLTHQFSRALKIDKGKVTRLIASGREELAQFAELIQFDLTRSKFFKQTEPEEALQSNGSGKPVPSQKTHSVDGVEILEENLDERRKTSEKALSDGIQDITNTLTGDCTINQVMQMIMETIYRALAGSRVVLCLKDAKKAAICARFGYGDDVDTIIRHLSIPLAYHPDVFHIAFKNNVDIRIEDTQDAKIKTKIPDWYHSNIAARSFTIFPIVVKHSPIALIYIDNGKGKPIPISDNQLGLLKTLRNQAILAIKSNR
jgi:serine/threonine protein kinase